jgi:hypothetical protein
MIEKLLSTIGFLGHWVLHHELKAYNVHNILQHVGGPPSHRLFPALAIPEALHLPFNSARPLGMASEEARLLVPLSGINFWTFTSFSDKKRLLILRSGNGFNGHKPFSSRGIAVFIGRT